MAARIARPCLAPAAFLLCLLAGSAVSRAQESTLSNAALTGSRTPTFAPYSSFGSAPTGADFASARLGTGGVLVGISPNPGWVSSLTADPAAGWMSTMRGGDSLSAPSGIIAIPFDVVVRRAGYSTLDLTFAVDDLLGSPSCPGVWVGPDGGTATPLAGSSGIGGFGAARSFVAQTFPVSAGRNYLYLVLNNSGGPGGIIFTGSVRVVRGPGEIVIDTTNLIAYNDGENSNLQLKGVPFTTAVVNGIAEFRVQGDLNLAANEVVSVIGSRPCRLIIGGNLSMAAGSSIEASAINAFNFAGGGAGGSGIVGAPGTVGGFSNELNFEQGLGGLGGFGCLFCQGARGSPGAEGSSRQGSSTIAGSMTIAGSGGGVGFSSSGSTPGAGGGVAAGTPGAVSVFANRIGLGGLGGAGGSSASSGSNGGNAPVGATGTTGPTGEPGAYGAQGLAGGITTGINILAAGSGAGSGSGGGGGVSGGGGCLGASGGGGGGGGGHGWGFERGGGGGTGGLPGVGGQGGTGGRGGISGAGGSGGGIIDVIVLGKVTGSGSLLVKGGNGLIGVPGEPGFDGNPGYAGGPGTAGYVIVDPLNEGGDGGTAGQGGTGGTGGTGGPGGNGGVGGGGAGGCVRLFASVMRDFTGLLNTRAGRNGFGGVAPATSNGAMHFAFNSGLNPTGQDGTVFAHPSSDAPRGANPHIVGNPATPYIPDLANGPAPFGMLPNVTAAQLFPNRPASACMGFLRYAGTAPPSGLPSIPGFDYCIVANLIATDLVSPQLGIGVSRTGLRRGGRDADPALGSAFATLPTLPAGSVWVTMRPVDSTQVSLGCTLVSPVFASGAGTVGAPIYVSTPSIARLFVDGAAPAGGTGGSWASALSDLRSALNVAALAPPGAGAEISVAGGLYSAPGGFFQIPGGYTIRGGYAGRTAAAPDTFDPARYHTVLTGDLANDDSASLQFGGGSLFGNPPGLITGNHSFTVSVWLNVPVNGARQGVVDFGQRSGVAQNFNVLIDSNGTCTAGFANGWSNSFSLVGLQNTWVHIATVYDAATRTLTSYRNGQQIVSDSTTLFTPNLTAGAFSLNVGLAFGGGAGETNYRGKMRALRIWNTTRTRAEVIADMAGPSTGTEAGLAAYYPMDAIVANSAVGVVGGGLPIAGIVTVAPGSRTDNSFDIAVASLAPGAQAGLGYLELRGARRALSLSSGGALTMDDVAVTGCASVGGGSVIEISGGSTLTATDAIVSGNSSTSAMIVRAFPNGGNANFDRTVFSRNQSAFPIVQSDGARITISNSVIENNQATFGVILSNVNLTNCTLVNNATSTILGNARVYNCVFSNNGAIGGNVDLRYSLLQTAYPGGGPGNIVGVPQFVNAGVGDYRLLPGAIGVDAGLSSLVAPGTSFDLAGNPRILDNPLIADAGGDCPAVDMGAYETAGVIPMAASIDIIIGSPLDAVAPAVLHLSALASSNVPVTVRWTRNGVNLSDGPSAGGGVISGATTLALSIVGAGPGDSGAYALVARASCRLTASDGVQFTVLPGCPADFNRDGVLDPDDLSDYIAAFFSTPQPPAADFNADGFVDPDDLADYIAAFFASCP